jgi:hypothetical protein
VPPGCREHLEEIVGWLVEEATKRGWWKYAVAVPGSRYFIERMVLGDQKGGKGNTTGYRFPIEHNDGTGIIAVVCSTPQSTEHAVVTILPIHEDAVSMH